jgi:hypothetical protein
MRDACTRAGLRMIDSVTALRYSLDAKHRLSLMSTSS